MKQQEEVRRRTCRVEAQQEKSAIGKDKCCLEVGGRCGSELMAVDTLRV